MVQCSAGGRSGGSAVLPMVAPPPPSQDLRQVSLASHWERNMHVRCWPTSRYSAGHTMGRVSWGLGRPTISSAGVAGAAWCPSLCLTSVPMPLKYQSTIMEVAPECKMVLSSAGDGTPVILEVLRRQRTSRLLQPPSLSLQVLCIRARCLQTASFSAGDEVMELGSLEWAIRW